MNRLLLLTICYLSFSGRICSASPDLLKSIVERAMPITKALGSPGAKCVAGCGGAANLYFYQRDLSTREKHGIHTWRSTLGVARKRWAEYVFATKGFTYAAEHLSSAISSSTFMASSTLSLFALVAGYILHTMATIKANGDTGDSVWLLVQFGPVLIFLLSSAFNFSQAARLLTHSGFLFPIVSESNPFFTPETVMSVMLKSEFQQWYGTRYLYIAMVCAVWPLAGEWAFLVASQLALRLFQSVDRPPPSDYEFNSRATRKFVQAPY